MNSASKVDCPPWLKRTGDDTALKLHVQPGARRTALCGEHGEALKIKLAAPAVDGKANAALVEFLAQRLGVPKLRIVIAQGLTGRNKRVLIHNVALDDALRALLVDGQK